MRLYNVDFFDRSLNNIHHDSVGDLDIADDYISFQRNTMEIRYTDVSLANAYVYITRDNFEYFGVVVSAAPTNDNTVNVVYRNFLSVFDEDVLFNTNLQLQNTVVSGFSQKTNSKTLEKMLKDLISSYYVSNADTLQRLKITVTDETSTRPWGFNLKTDTEGEHYCIIGLYRVLIVNAMKKYGVGIYVHPDFENSTIRLRIKNQSVQPTINVDGNLHNLVVKTLKVNDRPDGVNKLTVYNTDGYSQSLDFYVHSNRTWDVTNSDRITPVVREVKGAIPDSTIADPTEAFVIAAIDVAYGVLSGLEWDNLIELEMATDDPIIHPLDLIFGQTIDFWYKGTKYTSILTGRNITTKALTLIFGSERIQLTKRSTR